MLTVTTEWLQSMEPLREVPANQLQWLIDNSEHYEVEEETLFFKTGDPIRGTHVLIRGKVRIFSSQAKGIRDIGTFEAGEITGYLPFSRGNLSGFSGQVIEHLQVMTLPKEKIKELISLHFELTEALVHVMTSRVRDFTTLQQQNEKMMALGKLSAGLAHELNNPASAIVRGSNSLLKHLKLQPETFKEVISIKMDNAHIDHVNGKIFEVLARKEKPVLTMMQRTALEDELAECLESHQVNNSQEMAENFIEFGFTCEDMDDFAEFIPSEYLSPVLNWVNNNLVTEKMVNDIRDSSQRIEKLVSAVKNFTHMDHERDKEYADIHAGIKNTLTMLDYKIKKGNVSLVEEYDTSLPPIKAVVGELNQVWTNLIDNALDAMEVNNKGRLEIKTKRDRQFVELSVIDNGPGIPDSIRNRIFDPFFTTKDIGKGTGLGLDVVKRIVREHKGSIKVDSEAGRTAFVVCFPIDG
jgi:signal transduction histidine kinase